MSRRFPLSGFAHLYVLPTIAVGVLGVAIFAPSAAPQVKKKKNKTDYNRDIRPILSKCFTCHGNDAKAVMAGLKLDSREAATMTLGSGNQAIVPGHPEKSALITRIFEKNPDYMMPPPDSHKVLNDEERQMLKLWIQEGAEYKIHWGFVAPVRPAVPVVKLKTWPKNAVDNFILEKLEENGLRPTKETDKRTLIRRVSLDLTGLPPTPAEIQAYLNDKSPKAYEKVVDRLLASPRYGERMAMDWMDYARYADSNGYQADFERFQYRWRDWVINAFNSNMPYDRFTVEQIAGDMLPNPTLDQRIATGFSRNHRINTEGGVVAEEWRVETVIDRVETTSAIWMGMTTGCARCHDHKYDPLSQKEFYGLTAFFNSVPESGTGEERPVNHPPFIKAPYPEQAKQMTSYQQKLVALNSKLKALLSVNAPKSVDWQLAKSETVIPAGPTQRYVLSEQKPTGDAKPDLGRSTGAIVTKGGGYLDLGDVGNFTGDKPFSYALWVNPENGAGSPVARMDSAKSYRGWDLSIQNGRAAFHLISNWPEDAIKVISKTMIPNKAWTHIVVAYDGSKKASGVQVYVNGQKSDLEVERDALKGSTETTVPMTVGRRTNTDIFNGKTDDLILYNRALTAAEAKGLANVHPAAALLLVPADKRTKAQQDTLAHLWSRDFDSKYRSLDDERDETEKAKAKLDSEITTVMVMEEMKKPRPTYVLLRGQYDKHGDVVEPGIPAALPPLPKNAPRNRLSFAKWLVDPSNPLTSRVTVNRMWERLFGTGIVATAEDFGTRADFPSHPELLDWLATEFIRLKWDQKAMWKTLVMSATYRQASISTPALQQKDPLNRLLARGPRFRLPAEVLRDQAMLFGGLLTEKVGGPSVRPYQPEGIWDETNVYGNLRNYKHDKGGNLYRRSLYTIWKRTAAPPDMTLFDVPSREYCRITRPRTNTPLQALALMNDITYVEAARALAQRMIKQGGTTPEARLRYAFQTVLGRDPEAAEKKILLAGLEKNRARYKKDPAAAAKLLKQGEMPNDPKLNPIDIAAYTLTASTILNMDETVTKE